MFNKIVVLSMLKRVFNLPLFLLVGLVDLLKHQNTVMMPPNYYFHSNNRRMKKLRENNPGEENLCSIPEETLPKLSFLEEETISHRSPVTLANGYKPVFQITEDLESSNEELDTTDEEDLENDDLQRHKYSKVWRFLALIVSILRCVLVIFFLGTLFVIFVIFTHEDKSG